MTPTPGCYAVATRPVTREGDSWFSPPVVVAPAGTWAVVRKVTGIFATRVTVVFLGSGIEAEAGAGGFDFYADAPAARDVRPTVLT